MMFPMSILTMSGAGSFMRLERHHLRVPTQPKGPSWEALVGTRNEASRIARSHCSEICTVTDAVIHPGFPTMDWLSKEKDRLEEEQLKKQAEAEKKRQEARKVRALWGRSRAFFTMSLRCVPQNGLLCS